MLDSFSIVTTGLILVSGVLVPLYIVARMLRVLRDERLGGADKVFAGGVVIFLFVVMGFAIYAAQEISGILDVLARAGYSGPPFL